MKKLIIMGERGHRQVVVDAAVQNSCSEITFLNGAEGLVGCSGFLIIGMMSAGYEFEDDDSFVAIGDTGIRSLVQESFSGQISKLVRPKVSTSRCVKVGVDGVVLAGAIVNTDAVLGHSSITATGAGSDCYCRVADFAYIFVDSCIVVTVLVDDKARFSFGGTMGNDAVIIRNIDVSDAYMGIHAKYLRTHGRKVLGVACA